MTDPHTVLFGKLDYWAEKPKGWGQGDDYGITDTNGGGWGGGAWGEETDGWGYDLLAPNGRGDLDEGDGFGYENGLWGYP